MSTFSPVSPDTYEKPSTVREVPVTQISSNSASSTASLPAQQDAIMSNAENPSAITPMPVWMDTSLAVMTLGLSVPAFHIVKGISDRKAKKAQKKQQANGIGAAGSYLVPSSVVRSATTSTDSSKISELDSSPTDQPPPYAVEADSRVVRNPPQDVKAKPIAELP